MGYVLAFLVGAVFWGATAILGAGLPSLPGSWVRDVILFAAPVALFVVPFALRAANRGAGVRGVWMLAFAPLLGMFNLVLDIFFTALAAQTVGEWLAALALSTLWLAPLLWVDFRGGRRGV